MTTHEVLVEARNLIDRGGWLQYDMGGPGRGYCAIGACLFAGDLSAANALMGGAHAAVLWNNAPGRTKEEVLALFDGAIAATAPLPNLDLEVPEAVLA